MEKHVLHDSELNTVTGGADGWEGLFDGPWKTVCNLTSGYLALRTAPYEDESDAIGELYNGQSVQIVDNSSDNGYTWVYAPTLNKSGWVNSSNLG